MRKSLLTVLPALLSMCTFSAMANWQYDGIYIGDGWYADDGSRFIMSARGGASFGMASIKNEVGALTADYVNMGGVIVPAASCGTGGVCTSAGSADLSTLPPTKDFESFAFTAGASIGFTVPYRPQWRIELGWDHITESEYNASPLFEGDVALSSGVVISVPSGGVQSKITTDIISVMAFYDFYDGLHKPTQVMIPYIGFGAGYSDTQTVMNLADLYGDLSSSWDLSQNFGTPDSGGILQFNRSETNTANVAFLAAAGISYGITDGMFVDLGLRVAYIPKIKWALTNDDDTRQRDWFSGENLVYTNVMLGLRFEF